MDLIEEGRALEMSKVDVSLLLREGEGGGARRKWRNAAWVGGQARRGAEQ